MSHEDVVEFMEHYGRSPHARVHVIGQSLGGRDIYRLEITERSPQASSRALSGALSTTTGKDNGSTKLATKLATCLRSASYGGQAKSIPLSRRWAFHVNQQHSGEHHGKWRMIGMIDWLLSDAGVDFRRRSVWHFVLEMNPDGPTNGWYRVNAESRTSCAKAAISGRTRT